MKTAYSDIEITYDEAKDDWSFELRGRSRRAPSLAKAKEAIDKEPTEKRKQTFPKFEAYFWSYNAIKVVTVTSVAEDPYHRSGSSFWIVCDGARKKEKDYSLYPVNEYNTALVEQIKAKDAERDLLDEKIKALREDLQKATVPAEIAA